MKFSNLPCDLKLFESDDDFNYLKVKLRIVNIGSNLNKTKFSEDAIKNAEESIFNIPILGYLKYDEDDEVVDFDGHNMVTKIVQTSEGLKLEQKYLERPIGLIPESTEITYEEYDGSTYLCATGYIWKCYANEGYQLLLDADEKSVSMEISVLEGETDESDGFYDIKKFAFLGVTVLGDDVMPGIEHANITKYAHMQNYKKAIEEMCNEIYKFKKEGEVVKKQQNKEPQNQEFGLSTEVISDQILNQLATQTVICTDYWGDEYKRRAYWLRTILPTDNIAVVESTESYVYFGIPYSVNEDTITLDFEGKKEYIAEWREKKGEESQINFDLDRDSELKEIVLDKFSKQEDSMKEINSQLEGLQEFKKNIDDAKFESEINEVIESFSFEEDEIKPFKEKVLNREITKEEFQKELYALQGMKYVKEMQGKQDKKDFSQDEDKSNEVKLFNNKTPKTEPYGGILG